jgi:hypothetical protein
MKQLCLRNLEGVSVVVKNNNIIFSQIYTMPTCKFLRQQCKEFNIKGYSKMNKAQLESVVYLKQVASWYDELEEKGFVTINGLECYECTFTEKEQKIIDNDFNLSKM